jgi:hypothetical protein
MKTLRECFDSSPKHSDKWDTYFDVYERHLTRHRFKNPLTIVEVGVQGGGSLEMWAEHSPFANIIGIDIDPECAKLKYNNPKIKVVIGDQSNASFWDGFLLECPKIDIFIDDGGHFANQQVLTFQKVFPKLTLGGVYICEDTHTSYSNYNGGGLGVKASFIEYMKSLVDVLHYDWKEGTTSDLEEKYKLTKDLTSVYFYDSIVIIEKCGNKRMKRVVPKAFPAP